MTQNYPQDILGDSDQEATLASDEDSHLPDSEVTEYTEYVAMESDNCEDAMPVALAGEFADPCGPASAGDSGLGRLMPTAARIRGAVFRSLLSLIILVGGVGGAILIGQANTPATKDGSNIIIPTVETEKITRQEDGLTFTVDGVVVPHREVPIASEVSGRIIFLAQNSRVGRYVHKGDILLKIDPTDYELALAQATQQATQADRTIIELDVSVANAQRQLEIAREQLTVQLREVTRVQELSKTGAISKSDLDTTLLTELARQDAVQTLENQLRTLTSQKERLVASKNLADISVSKAKIDLQRCTITAPLDGVVVDLKVEQDKFVSRGEAMFTIHDTSRLEVQSSLYMKHVEWLWSTRKKNGNAEKSDPLNYYQFAPTEVTIVYKLGQTEYAWRGMLEYLDGAGLDSRTRMLPCRIVVENPLDVEVKKSQAEMSLVERPSLMPGMFVQVRVHVVPRRTLLNVSEMAILPGGTLWKVVDGTLRDGKLVRGRLARTHVTSAHAEVDRVLIYENAGTIDAGDFVVISPLASPIEGAEVEVLQ